MQPLITHFTDNDLYTFTCQYYILETYPRAEVEYTFFDRSGQAYPEGFAALLSEQMEHMRDVVITEEEIQFLKHRCYFLPSGISPSCAATASTRGNSASPRPPKGIWR